VSDTVHVAALGDSITSGSPAYDPDPAQRAALGFGDDERSQYEYWAEHKGGQTLFMFRNCGVFGERTDQIAARLDDCAEGADVLIVQGGINDIAQDSPIDAAARNLRSMVARGKELGLDVYLVDVLPWNNGHPRFDDAIADLNKRIDDIGSSEGVQVIGFHDALEDPGQPGVMPPELTADGDHPSVEGYRVLGELVARELSRGGSGP
jgi:lysophospholipase L1-like esterase